MPITPFHGGIGLAIKGLARSRFSFLLFSATQVAIDLEPAYHLLRGNGPAHRFFHTLIGATIVSVASVTLLRPVANAWLSYLNRRASTPRIFANHPPISWPVALTTAVAGVLGHIVPDAIMHYDVEPFAPFRTENFLYRVVSLGQLHLALVILGCLGAGMIVRSARTRD